MISVDNQIVWGLNIDTTPRRGKKRKEPQECPRYVELSIHLEDRLYLTLWRFILASDACAILPSILSRGRLV